MQQLSDAYSSAQRQVDRVSELSSLSSGFGDSDIAVPDPVAKPPRPASSSLRQSTNPAGRFSWVSQGRPDTVYTQSSEDMPQQYRSVNSWVDQQAGRVR